MATYTPLPIDEARRIALIFGHEVASVEGLKAGSVNSNYALTTPRGERLFLRIYEEQSAEGAAAEVELLGWLSERGVPVVQPLRAPDGGAVASLGRRPVSVFPWVAGEIRCQATVTPGHTRAVGEALARVHLAGAPRPRPGRFRVEDLRARCDVIEQAPQPELAALAPGLRSLLDEVEALRHPQAHRGLCHGDLFRDNVLWQGPSLAALLDFEVACDDRFAFDLAVTTLAWCYGDDFSGPLAAALVAGYQSIRPLPAEDLEALHAEAQLAALRFTVTRITDYAMRAHLGANIFRDYRRFLARFEALRAMGPRGWRSLLGLG